VLNARNRRWPGIIFSAGLFPTFPYITTGRVPEGETNPLLDTTSRVHRSGGVIELLLRLLLLPEAPSPRLLWRNPRRVVIENDIILLFGDALTAQK
jgi:hypothetical protein